ncbi:MAG: type II secretion system protein GspK [Kiritimatiellaeota bacterium]|nr:type II secretion system protein GspK [Kiritimatiellota bacterium]
MPRLSQNREQRGSVLIFVIILAAVLTGLVLFAQLQARRELVATQRALTQLTLHQAAAEGSRAALARLAADDDTAVDYLQKLWAVPQLATNPAGVVVAVRVTDENRFFDWNNLAIPPTGPQARSAGDIAMDLMNLGGDYTPVDRLAALGDWVDDDSNGLWETPFYHQQSPPYEAANRPLFAWSELLHVHGFSRDFFRPREGETAFSRAATNLLDSFTIVPVPRDRPVRVNVNTASREVLLAIAGVDQASAVQQLLALRESGPLRSLQPIRQAVSPAMQDAVERFLDVRSLYFRVEAVALQGEQTERIVALARRNENGALAIVQWIF